MSLNSQKVKSKILSIRASDKYSGTDSNFSVRVQKINKVVGVKFQNALIPLSMYNINTSNNSLTFNDGVQRTATLTPGMYTINQLCTEIKTQMDAISTLVFAVNFNSILQKVAFSSTSIFSLIFTSLTSDLPKLLGFNYATYSGTNSYVSNNLVNINRIYSQVNIYSDNLSRHNDQTVSSNLQDSNLICRINNSVYKPGEFLYYSHDDNSNFLMYNNPIGGLEYIDFKIKDLDGNFINFNGVSDGPVFNFVVFFIQ